MRVSEVDTNESETNENIAPFAFRMRCVSATKTPPQSARSACSRLTSALVRIDNNHPQHDNSINNPPKKLFLPAHTSLRHRVLHDLSTALDGGTAGSHIPAKERATLQQILTETLPEFATSAK